MFFVSVCVFVSAQGCVVSLNATASLGESYELQEGDEYAAEEYGAAAGDEEEEYGDLEGMDYNTGGNEDEVLDLQINEPLDDEFQVSTVSLFEPAVHFRRFDEAWKGLFGL